MSPDPSLMWVVPTNNLQSKVLTLSGIDRAVWPQNEAITCRALTKETDTGEFVESDHPMFYYRWLLFSAFASKSLSPLMSTTSFHVPVIMDTETAYTAYFITNILDALDYEKSEYKKFDSGNIDHVFKHVFRSEVVKDNHIFHCKGLRPSPYVSDTFVAEVLRHDLVGFVFEEVWSDQQGAIYYPNADLPIDPYQGASADRGRRKQREAREKLRQRQERLSKIA